MMNRRPRCSRACAALMAAALSLSALTACGSAPAAQQPAQQSMDATQNTPPLDQIVFRGEELSSQVMPVYRLPYLGMEVSTPDALRALGDSGSVTQVVTEELDESGALSYALLAWCALSDAHKQQEIPGDAAQQWLDNLPRSGVLGVYAAGQAGQLDALSGCDQHKKLGESADGAYHYYLSTSSAGDPALVQAVQGVTITLTERQAMTEDQSYFSQPPVEMSGNVGEFSTTDIHGSAQDQSLFAQYDLTLVNLFATWCSPCVNEIPELEKLYQQMQAQGVGVAGFVLDARSPYGTGVDEEAVEKARVLAERTGATFPMLIPDENLLGGRLALVDTVPQTIFIDRAGNIVGDLYVGARSLEDWQAVVDKELAALQEAG